MNGLITRAAGAALVLALAWAAPAAAESTQVLQAGDHVGAEELSRLTGTLASAGDTPVVLRVPGSATIDADADALRELDAAADVARFYVVQQGGDAEIDGAAAILTAFASGVHRQEGAGEPSGEPGELWQTVQDLRGCIAPCAPGEMPDLGSRSPAIEAELSDAHRPLAQLLDEAAPGGGGPGIAVLLGGLLILAAGGLGVVALLKGRQRPVPTPAPSPPPTRPPARPVKPAPGPPPPRPPAPAGGGRRAQVVSVLDPEGYVELDGCLRRARWASNGNRPVPGDWVEIETRGKRLWAYAASRPTKERRRSRELL